MKPIRFSPHALSNLLKREIPRDYAEATIRKPDRREPARPPREFLTGKYFDAMTGETMLLRVIVEENETEIAVVTLYKTSNFKKYLPEGTT